MTSGMYSVLSTARLLLDTSPARAVELAVEHGFEGIDPMARVVLGLPPAAQRAFADAVADAGLRWGTAGLPVQISRSDDSDFDDFIERFSDATDLFAGFGVTTWSTWILPGHDDFDPGVNLSRHVSRLNRLAPILREAGARLALEYVGPVTFRRQFRHEFVWNLAGTHALIGALEDPGAFGVLLDTFHWYTAGETTADIEYLAAEDVLSADLNDAPVGVERDDQLDMERVQPGATGVIDLQGFVTALRRIGYAGPVQSEPYSTALTMQDETVRVLEAKTAVDAALSDTQR